MYYLNKKVRGEMSKQKKNQHKKLCVLYTQTLPDTLKISFLTIIMVFGGYQNLVWFF